MEPTCAPTLSHGPVVEEELEEEEEETAPAGWGEVGEEPLGAVCADGDDDEEAGVCNCNGEDDVRGVPKLGSESASCHRSWFVRSVSEYIDGRCDQSCIPHHDCQSRKPKTRDTSTT